MVHFHCELQIFYLVVNFQDAVKREVKEESGYEFNPKALIAMEIPSFSWVRFTFVGKIANEIFTTMDSGASMHLSICMRRIADIFA